MRKSKTFEATVEKLETSGRTQRPLPMLPCEPGDRLYRMLEEAHFQSILEFEQKRAARSLKPFALMLLHASLSITKMGKANSVKDILVALASSTRETDLIGWYEQDAILGVIFTEIAANNRDLVLETLRARVESTMKGKIDSDASEQIVISVSCFPELADGNRPDAVADETGVFPASSLRTQHRQVALDAAD